MQNKTECSSIKGVKGGEGSHGWTESVCKVPLNTSLNEEQVQLMIASFWESTANVSYDAREMQVPLNIIYLLINIIYNSSPRNSPQQLLYRTP